VIYTIIPPTNNLKKYVRHFWVLEGEASIAQPYIHRTMADGSAELIFHYKGVFDELISDSETIKSFSAGLDAQSQKIKRYNINQNFGIFGVYLYPFAVNQFFGIPAAEVSNQSIDLKTLLGKNENGLEEKIHLAKTTEERIAIITKFLEDKLVLSIKSRPGVFESINNIIHSNGFVDINVLAEKNFLSRRQFERSFKVFSGFSPKVFTRISRFQNALKDYGNASKTLTQIGLDAGYADQSHFIKEFKEFSGYTPKEYFINKGEGTEWRENE
jgi:AraC-like DNA-binding protein